MPRKVVASTYVTLDGYVDEPGRWSLPFWSMRLAKRQPGPVPQFGGCEG